MIYRKLFTLTILLLTFFSLSAQQTAIYKDALSSYKRGRQFYDQQLYGKAREEFKHMLYFKATIHEKDVETYQKLAKLYDGLSAMRLNRQDGEAILLDFIRENDPSSIASKAKLEVGRYYYNEKVYDKAIAFFEMLETSSLTNEEITEVKFKQGYCYFVMKNFKMAKSLLRQTKDVKDQYYYPSNYYFGLIAFFEDKYDEALTSFMKIKKSKHYRRVIPSYITQIHFAQRNFDEVIKYAAPLVDDNSVRNQRSIKMLVGQSYFEKGNYKKALPLMESYVENSSKVSKELLYQLGFTQYQEGKFSAAIDNFEQLNALEEPLGQSSLYYMGDCHLKLDDKQAARASFQKASVLSYDRKVKEDATFQYSKLSAELGFGKAAIDGLKTIGISSPYYQESQKIMGDVFLNTRDYENALKIIRSIKSKTPQLKATYQKVAFYRAVQVYTSGDLKAAEQLFNESLQNPIDPTISAQSYYWKGEIYYTQDYWDGSIREFNNFITALPGADKLPENSSEATARYALGYSYIKQGDYKNAATNFVKTVDIINPNLKTIKDRYIINQVYPDAILRAADCYLHENNYPKATTYYNRVIQNRFKNTDYAMFQKSIILNLAQKTTEQLVLLEELVNSFPSSPYVDDALYSMGATYIEIDRPTQATSSFKHLLETYPNSVLTNHALLRLGLVAFNQGQNEKALDYYKRVFTNNPDGKEARSALRGIEEIYIEMGNPEAYFTFLETVSGYQVSDLKKDSISFKAAEMPYRNGDYGRAIITLGKYIRQYPKGINLLKARYYRAESHFQLKQYQDAYVDYDLIVKKGNSNYLERSALIAGDIAYKINKEYSAAFILYSKLESVTQDPNIKLRAIIGVLKSAYRTSKWNNIKPQAQKVIETQNSTNFQKAEANYYLGQAALQEQQLTLAKSFFDKVVKLNKDSEISAESRYQIARIHFEQGDFAKAEELSYNTNQEIPNHPFWLVKSFILLSDIYAKQNKLFQAKATLEGIIDNYTGDQSLIDEAKDKLARLQADEAQKSKIAPGSEESDLLELDESEN